MPMKTALALTATMALLALSAGAGPESIIKQRAKELRDQNNVEQGVASPSQPNQPPAATPGKPQTPLQRCIARLQADLSAIQPHTPPSPQQNAQFTQDLIATAQATKPSQQAAAKLAADVSAALAENPMAATERNRLLSDINAALNPANIQTEQMKAILADAQAIFQVTGLKRSAAVTISDDLKAVAAETQRR